MKDGIKTTDKHGTQFWCNDDNQFHRLNNLPAVVYISGYKEYCINNIDQKQPEQYTLWICNKGNE